jgi:antitoxin Phd
MKNGHVRKKNLVRSKRHKRWQVQEAKAQFSQLLDETVSFGYQLITKNGEPVAYIVSKEEFERFLKPRGSILEVFDRCPYPDIELDIRRSQESIRDPDL